MFHRCKKVFHTVPLYSFLFIFYFFICIEKGSELMKLQLLICSSILDGYNESMTFSMSVHFGFHPVNPLLQRSQTPAGFRCFPAPTRVIQIELIHLVMCIEARKRLKPAWQ